MSKHGNDTYCDYIECHLVIAPQDKGAVRGLQLQFHGACWIKLQHDHKRAAEPKKEAVCAT